MRRTVFISLLAALPLLALAAAPTVTPKTVTLAMQNMTCPTCPITVRMALKKVPGVTAVKVDFSTKTATVTYDPAKVKVAMLTKATTDAGYPSTVNPVVVKPPQ